MTARELEVLAHVAEGLRNADIAARLFLSEKTVAHHVSAILRKLDVPSRGQAGMVAARLGLVER
jgi:DNA-binding NarL/FixJ family response regulator